MKLVIETQCYENYGSHDWNGEGICPQNWKAKGGSTFIVENFIPDYESQSSLSNQVYAILTQFGIEREDDYYHEYLHDWSVEDEDYVHPDEVRDDEWDADPTCPYSGDVRYWKDRLDLETNTKTAKFRGYDGELYVRTWKYENGTFVENSYSEKKLVKN